MRGMEIESNRNMALLVSVELFADNRGMPYDCCTNLLTIQWNKEMRKVSTQVNSLSVFGILKFSYCRADSG